MGKNIPKVFQILRKYSNCCIPITVFGILILSVELLGKTVVISYVKENLFFLELSSVLYILGINIF